VLLSLISRGTENRCEKQKDEGKKEVEMAVDGIPPQFESAKLTNSTNPTNSSDKLDKHGELNSLDDAAGILDSSKSEEVVAIVPNGITPGQKGPEVLILPADDPVTPGNTVHPSYPASNLELPDHHIDEVRSLRVTVIGAGLAGILAGILLPAKVPNIQLTILEKNTDVVSEEYFQRKLLQLC
jgi:hypothetical protein